MIAYWRFRLKSVAGKTFPASPAHAQPAILRIWQKAYEKWSHGLIWLMVVIVIGELMWSMTFPFDWLPQRHEVTQRTRRNKNVTMTSTRIRDVVLTSQWRYYCVVCPLGTAFIDKFDRAKSQQHTTKPDKCQKFLEYSTYTVLYGSVTGV